MRGIREAVPHIELRFMISPAGATALNAALPVERLHVIEQRSEPARWQRQLHEVRIVPRSYGRCSPSISPGLTFCSWPNPPILLSRFRIMPHSSSSVFGDSRGLRKLRKRRAVEDTQAVAIEIQDLYRRVGDSHGTPRARNTAKAKSRSSSARSRLVMPHCPSESRPSVNTGPNPLSFLFNHNDLAVPREGIGQGATQGGAAPACRYAGSSPQPH
jgi:hypothetical protein